MHVCEWGGGEAEDAKRGGARKRGTFACAGLTVSVARANKRVPVLIVFS